VWFWASHIFLCSTALEEFNNAKKRGYLVTYVAIFVDKRLKQTNDVLYNKAAAATVLELIA
jgi:hypothetical protein